MHHQQDACWHRPGLRRTLNEVRISPRSVFFFFSFADKEISHLLLFSMGLKLLESLIRDSNMGWQCSKYFFKNHPPLNHKLSFLVQEGFFKFFFLELSRAPCSGRRGSVGLSLIRASGGLEIGEPFVHMCACPCQSTCVYVCEGVGVGGWMHVLRND